MKIGIIGTGNIGGTLARKSRAAGHDVRVANSRGVEGVKPFADEIGATAVDIRAKFRVKAKPEDVARIKELAAFSPVFNTITNGAMVEVEVALK